MIRYFFGYRLPDALAKEVAYNELIHFQWPIFHRPEPVLKNEKWMLRYILKVFILNFL